MVVHIGGVRPSLSTIRAGKLGSRSLKPDAEAVPEGTPRPQMLSKHSVLGGSQKGSEGQNQTWKTKTAHFLHGPPAPMEYPTADRLLPPAGKKGHTGRPACLTTQKSNQQIKTAAILLLLLLY